MTSLFGGTKISKNDSRIEAYGTIDELNSNIGLLLSLINEEAISDFLESIQSLLFDIGSHLASDGTADKYLPELNTEMVNALEKTIDNYTEVLPELKSFIMPRGNQRIAQSHICRTVCRRAERRVVLSAASYPVEEYIIIFLNRLSDYFFVLARYLGHLDGIGEDKWIAK